MGGGGRPKASISAQRAASKNQGKTAAVRGMNWL